MPRVPQVFSPGETGRTPGPRLDPGGFAQATTGGLQQAAGELGRAAKQYEHIYTTLRAEDEKLDAERALGEVQRQFVDLDIQLKQDPDITPEQYPQEVERRLRTLREGVSKTLKYPGSRMLFERGIEGFATQKVTAAKYEGLERMHAAVKATTDLVLREDVNQAVHGATPQLQEEGLNRAMSRIGNLMNRRILSGGEANTKTASVLAQVEEGRLRRDFNNPVLAPGIVAGLTKGKYPNLGVEGQRQLAHALVQEQKAAEAAFKKEREEAEKVVAEEAEKGITDSIAAGNWNVARGFLTSARKFLPATRYEHWQDTIANREGKGKPSEPVVFKALNLDVNSVKSDAGADLRAAQSVHGKIEAAYRANQLDDKDYTSLIGKANTRIAQSQNTGVTELGREHAQAEQLIKEALRVPAGEFSMFLSGQAQNLTNMALEDLTRNSAYLKQGNEPPLKWYTRQKLFYQSQLDTVASQRLSDIERQLRSTGARLGVPITDAATLAQSKTSFRNEADYYDAVRLFKESQEIRRLQQSFKPAAGPKPATTPTAGAPSQATPAAAGVNPLGRR